MKKNTIFTYKDLIVWQRAMELVKNIYILVKNFPDSEKYILTSQIKRAAISIPANIAEGRRRKTRKDYIKFLSISYASGAELETLLEITEETQLINKKQLEKCNDLLNEIMRMLNKMIQVLNNKTKFKLP